MASTHLSAAFQRRNPRPQAVNIPPPSQVSEPTTLAPSLKVGPGGPSWKSSRNRFEPVASTTLRHSNHTSAHTLSHGRLPRRNIDEFCTLGTLRQGSEELVVCTELPNESALTMLRRVGQGDLQSLSIQAANRLPHPNVLPLLSVVDGHQWQLVAYPYSRFTLAEILTIGLKFRPIQIRYIAGCLFAAVQHLRRNKMIVKDVSLHMVRFNIWRRTLQLDLGIEQCVALNPDDFQKDYESLATLLLRCVVGNPFAARNPSEYQQARQQYSIDGALRAELVDLFDFLDWLLTADKSVRHRHAYIEDPDPPFEIFEPILERAALECVSIYLAA